ncbi:[Acyl-carrier-protein] acetyl transferase of FASI / Enoyl-[acyl-carrier-protein] reductase of FASI / 3-hydroxypalmitoyl-[acyl-carrier-protein] dehydratase of FASI / [Acyl-carrier-protein] malonyl transferase of FASI / [Acyl-carrier-protein] palmitoyl transferase of FASI / Acyl carrier protein of FASI / 3-oxoacyl-[acyl-carrier-protein] reductase of FASI / 3-oxoacyl-[acyl-carrier-protein] synthase of FASI [Corynebacterium glutamicum]|uniref:type I polyketide synthase n=1 Tax=Corynebacterium glutamicum TaxID=1718 RepID=UPI00097E9CDC|nr:type I polyketide synthase [Corynebacterium glutamicum]SJM63691.1 [Acyl-carrier-protein] acetyl transferase of FASI / Enoyl-[acyl-carrier-protein] reductase of FASI / 3-hydroxypalmitoyl-[acyl-carrier-protein] dehydratase of FASI / [Acyl-carrier-protein] malonyl transferase of FASI / [Acyl-carrier-protein] palmitoyl transferase of FASI / Acyl carrier protein of FASI / 3-oxoacyl-[acyl-carrier-protein] reductase of FASI / 3-oxoacyl-[acyl-carrier-protein] synthase of FASI [Corynebacterium glutamicu
MTELSRNFGASRLINRFGQEPFAFAFAGQGYDWLKTLRAAVAAGAGTNVSDIVERANALLAPVADDLIGTLPFGFDPVAWANNSEDPAFDTAQSAVSVPGIFVSQIATLDSLEAQRLDVDQAVSSIGHSQGVLGVHLLNDATRADELVAIAQLIGAAITRTARMTGLIAQGDNMPMLSIAGISREQLQQAIDAACAEVPAEIRPVIGLRNSRDSYVLVGRPDDNARVVKVIEAMAAKDKKAIEDKLRGGSAFSPRITPLKVQAAFHHPAMNMAVEQTVAWATTAGLDVELTREIAADVLVNPVDWVARVNEAYEAGARWFLDVGPDGGIVKLTANILEGRGADSFYVGDAAGQAKIFDAGMAPELPVDYQEFAPRVEHVDGTPRLVTKFTELTGRTPMMLAGMTPTTVDPAIVAAAANGGHWAELAGGGQVTPELLETHIAQLTDMLEPGINAQFNSMFLDPYLWKMQIGGKRLVPKARANGASIDGIVITAGIPEKDEAVALVKELMRDGFPWIAFKPGAIKQVNSVLAIAKEVPELPIIIQIEGGVAGGHHSWEDLDELLIATYGKVRALDNVVLCVGGGIGSPERAADYVTGSWSTSYGLPAMPVDGILVGTAAMATKEATTSQAVKELLVSTQGSDEWVPAGGAKNGMASGRSQLGADIHEIDNSFAKAGRLLDEVAGDETAVQARRDEIIEAIGKTAKVYFGDIGSMTYEQWLNRYLELSGPVDGQWIDASWAARFAQMLERAEARLIEQDHGQFEPSLTAEDGVDKLVAAYPHAATDLLTPADVAWFLGLCRTPGKPVNFVPVIDKDVRRWWRSDSLWQSHDDRYTADQVAIIPGVVAVAGITKANEPVADLLDRFVDATIERIDEHDSRSRDIMGKVLSSPGTFWAGRNIPSVIHSLGHADKWSRSEFEAFHGPTGANLVYEDAEHAMLTVPLAGSTAFGTTAELKIRFTSPIDALPSAVPLVTQEDAEAAMGELTRIAAGGTLATVNNGTATWETSVDAGVIADYNNVTAGYLPASVVPAHTAPDVLVGRAWPAVFAAVKSAVIPGTDSASVVEGMLSLVHLEHHIVLKSDVPTDGALKVSATADEVVDTDLGRLVIVRAEIADAEGNLIATLAERFAIRGRKGNAVARTNTSALPTTVDTPRSARAVATVVAPESMRPFAVISGDRNPIHVSDVAASLAGLPGVIVHGMWTSAIGELIAGAAFNDEQIQTPAAKVVEYTATMLAPVLPGEEIEFNVERSAVDNRPGMGEVRTVTATVNGNLVLTATAVVAAPSTFYAFPGQGIQSQGMGMEARRNSQAARAIWDRADAHTRNKLGFSIVEIVENNPREVTVAGEKFFHPDGVLYLTQFTQVGMATLGVAQIAEMREAHALNQRAYFAGHSVGEYNALAAYAGVLSLESVLEIVYRRGLTMHRLVDRDENGLSNYGLAALRPNKMGLTEDNVFDYVSSISEASGEFLEIVNYNLAGLQYAVAGTQAGLAALRADVENRAPGQRAFILIPGIDVPFHSSKLRDGVGAFREHLDSLIPAELDLDVLVGRYVPNLVARPFELTEEFVTSMAEVVESTYVNEILADFKAASADKQKLARTLLIELLAWQFASPVRWIETQDLLIKGLQAERFVEVGVGSAPTLANMMGQTLRLPQYSDATIEVLNIERDRPVVFATDEVVREVAVEETPAAPAETTETPATPATPAPVAAAAPATGGPRPDDISFTPSDATEMLIAIWTKVRPDQMGATDSIETLVEGVSSRRNQLLLDLGVEFGLGAIDGAADAELGDLKVTVSKMAKGYKAFGPVLSDAATDALRRLTGPTGKRPGYVAERVTGTWELGQGWADHVVAEVVIGAREGASLRGGDLASLSPASPASASDLDSLIDAAVQAVASRRGVAVSLPSAGGAAGGVVDSAALGEFAEQVTGHDGVLAQAARTILTQLGLDKPATVSVEDTAEEDLYELVSKELGSDWPRQVAPSFDEEKVVLLDDRWASAREDLSRVALGELAATDINVTGAGEAVAAQAEFFGLDDLAAQARDQSSLDYADDVAVVTGGSPNSIAAAVVEKLLAGGATVIATTSNLGHDRLEFYKDLYARSARGTAALWIVAANLSSYSDIDDIINWVGSEQTTTVNGASKLVKPALVPTLLFPFAAPRVSGSMADAGPQAESQMRLLLWSVERLIAGLAPLGSSINVGHRLHVVIPGSPNRGRFGGDGAYGESKAALDAVVTRWNAEQGAWGANTSLVHAHIGWVRGTGLMGGNDPLVKAAEEAGVETYSTQEIAEKLLSQATSTVREQAASAPITVDFTGGLGESDLNLAEMARAEAAKAANAPVVEAPRTVAALPTPYRPVVQTTPDFAGQVTQDLDEMVVIVGAGELGPLGSARTRFDAELNGSLSAAGVIELAWTMGLIHWDEDPKPGWYDDSDEAVAEEDIFDRYHDEVMARVGVRKYNDMPEYGMIDNFAPELTTVYLDQDLTFNVGSREEALTYVDSEPELTFASFDEAAGEWKVTRKAGSAIRVPRRMAMTRFVGGQVPKDFNPAVWGIPADMVDNLDTVALWNIVCTVDAFLSAGFTPAELLASVHPARVSSTQGTGMGGMESLRGIYVDRILAEPRANDVLQEALPNVVAAHVMQSYVGGYGQMIHPVAACATAAVSVEEALDKIRIGKSDFVVAGGFDALSVEGITGFGDMAATADSAEMEGKGIEHRFFSRANDRRRGGFIESEGGGTVLLARASLAADLGLPVLGVIGFAESFADGAHTSIPAPGLGALGAARDGVESRLAVALRSVGVSADEISIISKHDTSTNANDPNESDLHERIATAIGRADGNPMYVISQKSLTGHAKGGAAAFQMIGLTQVLRSGLVPANRALDCVDPVLSKHSHLVWLRKPLDLRAKAPKAGLVTSLGFGHVSAMVAVVHPDAFYEAVRVARGAEAADAWRASAIAREEAGLRTIVAGMHGGVLYERPVERNLGVHGDAAKEVEAAVLLDSRARLVDGVLRAEG